MLALGLRQQSLEAASRLLRASDSLAALIPSLVPRPPQTISTLGAIGIKQGDGFIAFLLNNSPRWVIDIRKFAGAAALTVKPRNRGLQVTLTGARLPGTDVPADLTLDLVLLPLGRVRMTLKLVYGGFAFTGDFAAWLAGTAKATAPVQVAGGVAPVGATGAVAASGNGVASFSPNWTLAITGVAIADVTGFGAALPADTITLALVEPGTISLFASPPPKRSFIVLTAGGPWKNLDPPVTTTPIGTLTDIAGNFDVMFLDVGEDAAGKRRQALLTGSLAGFDAAQFELALGSGPTDPEGQPMTLQLRHALLLMVFDPPAPASTFMAAFMPAPRWGRAGGIGFAVAGVAVEGEFVLTTAGDAVTSILCQPGLIMVAPPVTGTAVQPLPLAAGVRLAFVPASPPPASPPPPDWVAVGALAQKTPRASFLDYAFALLRPRDLLWLGYGFANVTLRGDDAGAPQLVPGADPTQGSSLSITLAPQNIGERAYFETAANYTIPPNPLTGGTDTDNASGSETPEEPPIPARMAGRSRLAFVLPASLASLPLDAQTLLFWEGFAQSVVPAALPVDAPQPADIVPVRVPTIQETAIEAPYRLILSPSALGRWRHALDPVEHDNHTELWHTRLGVPKQPGLGGDPEDLVDEGDDPQRAVRAVWSPDFPLRPLSHQHAPFRMSLDPRDRYEIVLLSAEFNLLAPDPKTGGLRPLEPKAVAVERLMLSSLGAWLRSRGAWEPPKIAFRRDFDFAAEHLSVEEWRHIAGMGRDQYVRVVYLGHLFPFGHRASLVKVTERKFQPAPFTGRMMAYLRQRMYIIVRQPERDYGALRNPPQPPALDNQGREFPFDRVRITTLTTPSLDAPEIHEIKISGAPPTGYGQDAFWPYVNGQPFLFHLVATDRAGQQAEFQAPLIFISQSAPVAAAADALGDYNGRDDLRRRDFMGQKVALAESVKAGDTTVETASLLFKAALIPVPAASDEAGFYPKIEQAKVKLPAVRQLSNPGGAANGDASVAIRYLPSFVSSGFNVGPGEVFAQLEQTLSMGFGGDKSLGVGTPSLNIAGLSRRFGTVGGNPVDPSDPGQIADSIKDFAGGNVNPAKFFDTSAKILGAISLGDLIAALTPAQIGPDDIRVLKVKTDTSDPKFIKTILDWTPDVVNLPVLKFKSTAAADKPVVLHAEVVVPLANPAQKSSTIKGTLTEFQINLADVIALNFHSLAFTAETGKKLDVNANLYKQDEAFPDGSANPPSGGVVFQGPLEFVNELRQIIPDDGFSDPPFLEVAPDGVTAGYSLKIPSVGVGIFSLENISLGAALTVPFTGDPVRARFNFSEREHPFLLSVAIFGGGGFFATGVGADGVELIEASLEFGGHVAIDLGVASGGVYVMAGIYFKGEQVTTPSKHVAVTLTGYFRAGGSLEVLGIISISMEFYLGLTYESEGNKVWGEARITVEVHVLFFSAGVTVTCRREFADPGFSIKDMLPNKKAWTDYAAAFA